MGENIRKGIAALMFIIPPIALVFAYDIPNPHQFAWLVVAWVWVMVAVILEAWDD